MTSVNGTTLMSDIGVVFVALDLLVLPYGWFFPTSAGGGPARAGASRLSDYFSALRRCACRSRRSGSLPGWAGAAPVLVCAARTRRRAADARLHRAARHQVAVQVVGEGREVLHDRLVAADQPVVGEHGRNRDDEAERGHDQRFTDRAGDRVDRGLPDAPILISAR